MPACLAPLRSTIVSMGGRRHPEVVRRPLPWPLWWALAINIGMVVLHALNHSQLNPFGRPIYFFHLNAEQNLPTWWATLQLYTVALLLGVAASRATGPGRWGAWLATGIAAFLSLDEFAQFHERVGVWLRTEAMTTGGILPLTGIWPILLGSLLAGACLASMWLGRSVWRSDPTAGALLLGGALTLIASAAGLELLINLVSPDSALLPWQIALEELGELIGAWLALWGAWRYAVASKGTATILPEA
jgi:hypothetical protein